MSELEILADVQSFASGKLPLDVFRQRFAQAYFSVRNDPRASQSAAQLCSRVVGPLAEFSRGHRSEEALRLELANAVRPFERPLVARVECVRPNAVEPHVSRALP